MPRSPIYSRPVVINTLLLRVWSDTGRAWVFSKRVRVCTENTLDQKGRGRDAAGRHKNLANLVPEIVVQALPRQWFPCSDRLVLRRLSGFKVGNYLQVGSGGLITTKVDAVCIEYCVSSEVEAVVQ